MDQVVQVTEALEQQILAEVVEVHFLLEQVVLVVQV
jgi:hypothetical protein